jgi:hypothetical protein
VHVFVGGDFPALHVMPMGLSESELQGGGASNNGSLPITTSKVIFNQQRLVIVPK